jgi:RimJ/RimL family protein N-acetyltransferase
VAMQNQIAFQTPRLEAHFANLNNKNLVLDLYNQKESGQFLEGVSGEQDFNLALKCYNSYQNIGSYLIFENQSKNFVGFGGVQIQEPMQDGSLALNDDIEFLIMISKQFSGFGYASEFSSIFLKNFFNVFPNLTIPARVNKDNAACIKLLTKLGFIYEGETSYHKQENKFHLLRINKELIKE